jgi:hypothetical protein
MREFHDAPLPQLQDDRTLMLASGSVLREQNRPGVGVRIDDRDAPAMSKADRTARAQHRDRAGDARDDTFLTPV